MPIEKASSDTSFVRQIEEQLGRGLSDDERRLAISLQHDKTPEMIAREMQGAVIADPKKIRPEHKDTADEP